MHIKSLLFNFILIILFGCDNSQLAREKGFVAIDGKTSHSSFPDMPRAASTLVNPKYSLEQLDNTVGLSNSSVNCIFQDSQKLIWIGTWDGLNRYDGSNFKIFRSELDNNRSLTNQVVLKIGEDIAGQIWILTMHGINRYDKKTDTFRHFYFSRKSKAPLSESEFNMALDKSKQVYCAVKDWGIGYFDNSSFQPLQGTGFIKAQVVKMEFSAVGEMLVLLDDGKLYKLFISNDKGVKSVLKMQLVSENLKTFCVLSNKMICAIYTTGEAFLISANGDRIKILNGSKFENIIGSMPESVVLSAKQGYITVDFSGNVVKKPWGKYLKNQKISTLIQGTENVIWSGTDGDGVFKMFPIKKSFNLISKAQIPELDGGIVRTFLEVNNNSFWLGTKGKGLFRLPPDFFEHTNQKLQYDNFNESNSIINNAVFALCHGKDDLVFIGTDGSGIAIYDLRKSKLISWEEIEDSEKCPFFKSTYAIYQDKDGFIWLGTNGYGMVRCKITRQEDNLKVSDIVRYAAGQGGPNALSSNIIFSIIPKSDHELWIGTRLGGLNLFDKKAGTFQIFRNVVGDSGSLSSNDILCLATDAEKKLWIGTSFGLNLLKSLTPDGKATFHAYTVKDGLPNNTIHGIVSDAQSNLWISTNFGLSNFARNPDKFINYSKSEGLQNNEFADGAFYNDKESGTIFMGGIKGFNHFLPQKIKESTEIPDLYIDKISGQNQAVPYYQGLLISPNTKTYPSIELQHNQNFFDIQLTALTFTNNEKCQYAYQLKGFDENWNTINNRKIISFTNVPRGNYSLWVRWSNSDGVWSDAVRAIDIRIKPVFWQSNLAILIYLVLFVCFALFVRSYYRKRQSLQQNILFRKNEEEIHENRLSFFTNIAHEFLTPLTLIAGPIQKLSETENLTEKNRKFIHMIQRNSSRLLFLTQQLLEFRKAEHDYLEIAVRKFDFVSIVEQIAELFDDWALDKKITYQLEVPSELNGWFDKDKLEKILFNLMSNAFKYTPVDGDITLKCRITDESQRKLNITIANSGKGIPKEKMDSLFDQFFLSDANQPSDTEMFRTGIGLAYIKKLVTVLRGEIIVSSVPNELTVFTVLIPCDKEAFTEREIDLEASPILISQHLKNILEEGAISHEDIPNKISAIDQLENDYKKILIVEDEAEIHAFLKDLLADKYTILTAFNGIEALNIMANEVPDLIISDVMMPLMDGIEFCKEVKTNIATCHIPFIMLTAKDSVLHRIEGIESGANSYIPKPFYPDHLLTRIKKLLEEKALTLKHFTQDTLVENLSAAPVDQEDKAFIKVVIDLIRKNIDSENLHSEFIEKILGISNSQLYRKTKQIFQLSPGDLIRTIRLKHAAELLRKDELTVSQICYLSGFNNRSYFYREFKKMYDMTPKSYQLQYKSKNLSYSNS